MSGPRLEIIGDEHERPVSPRDDLRRVARVVVPVVALLVATVVFPPDLAADPLISVAPARPTAVGPSGWTPLTLMVVPRERIHGPAGAECGDVDATTPAATSTGPLLFVRRIDIGIRPDAGWWWCVAAVRVYDDAVEIVGRAAAASPDMPTGSLTPLLSFDTSIGGAGGFSLGGAHVAVIDHDWHLLRYTFTPNSFIREELVRSIRDAATVYLRVRSLDGPWVFPPLPAEVPQPGSSVRFESSSASLHGFRFAITGLRPAYAGFALAYDKDDVVADVDWRVVDADGHLYYHASEGDRSGSPEAYFTPEPPAGARLSVSIARISFAAIPQFAVTLHFH